jgi:hypothetical protein
MGRNTQSSLKSAIARQSKIHMFITRLSTDTLVENVSESICRALLSASGGTIDRPRIECEAVSTKHDTYLSFHISVAAVQATKEAIIGVLHSADTWPDGVLVRRYYVNMLTKMDDDLSICSFNCRSAKSSVKEIAQLCGTHHFVLLQETWLLPNEIDFYLQFIETSMLVVNLPLIFRIIFL